MSSKQQSMDRQISKIKESYPAAVILQEADTGTKAGGRKEWDKIYKEGKPGDTIVFDSVLRMGRDVQETFRLYEEFCHRGIELVFLKEPHINTATYRKALQKSGFLGSADADELSKEVNRYRMALAKEQITLTFEQAEREAEELHRRTKEGIEAARRKGKQIGQKQGARLTTKKSMEAKEQIRKESRDFNGTLSDSDCMKLTGLARNTFYKYKRELKAEYETDPAAAKTTTGSKDDRAERTAVKRSAKIKADPKDQAAAKTGPEPADEPRRESAVLPYWIL
jgi:DNA invertase Pin-like site-specific DNA recombinase